MAVRRVRKRFCQDQLEVRSRSFCAMRDVVAFTVRRFLALIVGGVTGDVFRIFFRGFFGNVFGGVFGRPSESLLVTKPLGQPLASHQSQAHLSSDNDRMTLFFFLLFFERELCGTLLSLSFFGRELCRTLWFSMELSPPPQSRHLWRPPPLDLQGIAPCRKSPERSVPMKYCQRHTD